MCYYRRKVPAVVLLVVLHHTHKRKWRPIGVLSKVMVATLLAI
jgi:hypothetical protein